MITKMGCAVCLIAAVALAGCAVDPPDPDLARHFDRIESLQAGDEALSCPDLKAQVDELQGDINALEKQIASEQSTSSGLSFMSALASVASGFAQTPVQAAWDNAGSTVGNFGASQASGAANGLQMVEQSYQLRHDHLVQLYSLKNCMG